MNDNMTLNTVNDPTEKLSRSQPAPHDRSGNDVSPDEIDLLTLMQVVFRRRVVVLTVLAAAILTSLLVSLLGPRRYETAMTVFVRDLPQARAVGVTPQTLAAFAVSDRVLSGIGPEAEPSAFRSFFSVKLDSASRVLTITVSAPNADEARRRAERWLESFTAEVRDLIGIGTSDVPLLEVFTGPVVPKRPASPRTALNVAVAAVFGIFAGLAAAFVAESVQRMHERQSPARFS